MKIANSIVLKKYETDKFSIVKDNIYYGKDTNKYYITLYTILENNENTQYPLEDLLDKYYLNCTEVLDNCIINSKNVFIFELEGEKENILEISSFIGKEIS